MQCVHVLFYLVSTTSQDQCPVLIYCEDFVNKVLGAVVAVVLAVNWNEIIRPKPSIEDSLPCHEKFLQDVFFYPSRDV